MPEKFRLLSNLLGPKIPKRPVVFTSHLDPTASLIKTPAQLDNLVINQSALDATNSAEVCVIAERLLA